MAKGNKVKAVTAKVKVVEAVKTYSFIVKGKAKQESVVLPIDGKDKSFTIGQAIEAHLGQVKAPDTIKAIFEPVLAKHGSKGANFALSIKPGYGLTQFGYTKATSGNSWRGLVSFTDGQLCFHTFDSFGLTKAKIHELRQLSKLSVNRQGKNWVTVAYAKSNINECISMCNSALKVVAGK